MEKSPISFMIMLLLLLILVATLNKLNNGDKMEEISTHVKTDRPTIAAAAWSWHNIQISSIHIEAVGD